MGRMSDLHIEQREIFESKVVALLSAENYELQDGDYEEMLSFFNHGETPEDTAKIFLLTANDQESDDYDPSDMHDDRDSAMASAGGEDY